MKNEDGKEKQPIFSEKTNIIKYGRTVSYQVSVDGKGFGNVEPKTDLSLLLADLRNKALDDGVEIIDSITLSRTGETAFTGGSTLLAVVGKTSDDFKSENVLEIGNEYGECLEWKKASGEDGIMLAEYVINDKFRSTYLDKYENLTFFPFLVFVDAAVKKMGSDITLDIDDVYDDMVVRCQAMKVTKQMG